MHARLYADLEQRLHDWLDRSCDDTDWPDVIIGTDTVMLMATAAKAVFDACVEAQAYAKREGYMRDVTTTK